MNEHEDLEETGRRIGEVMAAVRLPLENLEFTIEQYLMKQGCRLDLETRQLLAGVRDCVGRIAVTTRRLETRGRPEVRRPPRAA